MTRIVYISALLYILYYSSFCTAFDTGHHSDATTNSLLKYGYSKDAIDTVITFNWFVDYFSYVYIPARIKPLQLLHYDSLLNLTEVKIQWYRLARNTKEVIQEATSERDHMKFLATIGLTLHGVQDFYTHSSWVEGFNRSECDCYQHNTFWKVKESDMPEVVGGQCGACDSSLKRGGDSIPKHGGYCSGLNKDQPTKDLWDEAYTLSYMASLEWINAIHQWSIEIDNEFWKTAIDIQYTDRQRNELSIELDYMYKLALWGRDPSGENNGHWKGPYSGSMFEFGAKVAMSFTLKTEFREFLTTNDKLYNQLAHGLYDFSYPESRPQDDVFQIDVNDWVIYIRTLEAEDLNPGRIGDADMYATIQVDNQLFIEPTYQNSNSISPHWKTLAFVSNGEESIDISYSLFDEDFDSHDQYDINPDLDSYDIRSLFYPMNSTLIIYGSNDTNPMYIGIFDTAQQSIELQGTGKDSARVRFYVSTKKISSRCDSIKSNVNKVCKEEAL